MPFRACSSAYTPKNVLLSPNLPIPPLPHGKSIHPSRQSRPYLPNKSLTQHALTNSPLYPSQFLVPSLTESELKPTTPETTPRYTFWYICNHTVTVQQTACYSDDEPGSPTCSDVEIEVGDGGRRRFKPCFVDEARGRNLVNLDRRCIAQPDVFRHLVAPGIRGVSRNAPSFFKPGHSVFCQSNDGECLRA